MQVNVTIIEARPERALAGSRLDHATQKTLNSHFSPKDPAPAYRETVRNAGSDFRRALDTSLTYNVFTVKFISGYLEKHHRQSVDLPSAPALSRDVPAPVLTRDLAEYSLQLDLDLPARPSLIHSTEGA